MLMKTDFEEARRMLVELLWCDDDAPVVGVDALSHYERDFLITTCAATIMLGQICRIAGFNEADALKGLAALQLDVCVKRMSKP
jgi:hypothetical protein